LIGPSAAQLCDSQRMIGHLRGARRLWEDWENARPFTAGKGFFNLGECHDVAFAADRFGSIAEIPPGFDEWEELAREVECNYVRGWVALDAKCMFLWDDIQELVLRKSRQFEYLIVALRMLEARGHVLESTEIWDLGGQRFVGLLGEMGLLATPRRY